MGNNLTPRKEALNFKFSNLDSSLQSEGIDIIAVGEGESIGVKVRTSRAFL